MTPGSVVDKRVSEQGIKLGTKMGITDEFEKTTKLSTFHHQDKRTFSAASTAEYRPVMNSITY